MIDHIGLRLVPPTPATEDTPGRPGGWAIEIREAEPLYRADGTEASRTYHRRVIDVGQVLTDDEDPVVRAVVEAVRR